MTKKRILVYILLSFLPVWGMTILYMLCGGKYESNGMNLILTLSMVCPAIAVIGTRLLTKEGFGSKENPVMLLGIDLSKGKWLWFLAAFLLPIIYSDLGIGLFYLLFPKSFDGSLPGLMKELREVWWMFPISGITNALVFSFGALGEEIGWRTYLYPKLEELFGSTKAIIFGGIIWGVWHYPAIYMGHNFGRGYLGEPFSGFFVFTIFTIFVGACLHYITKKTKSVWAAAFFHASNNVFLGNTLLFMALSKERVPKLAQETPIFLAIIFIPVCILGIVCMICLNKEEKSLKNKGNL